MRYESPAKYKKLYTTPNGQEWNPEGSYWNPEIFDKFCKDLNVKGMTYVGPAMITNSSKWFSRFLTTKYFFRTRMSEALSTYDDCMDRIAVQSLLFDHTFAFKTKDDFVFLMSAPYSTWELSKKAWAKLQKYFPELNGIDMFILDNDYKFIGNGDIVLIFIAWPYHRKCLSDVLLNGIGGDRIIKNGKVYKANECKKTEEHNDEQ